MWALTFYFLISFLFRPVLKPNEQKLQGCWNLCQLNLTRAGKGMGMDLLCCLLCTSYIVECSVIVSKKQLCTTSKAQTEKSTTMQGSRHLSVTEPKQHVWFCVMRCPGSSSPTLIFLCIISWSRETGGHGVWELRLETWNYNLRWTSSLTCSFL